MHGGNIGVYSEGKGKGATFYLQLPTYKKIDRSSRVGIMPPVMPPPLIDTTQNDVHSFKFSSLRSQQQEVSFSARVGITSPRKHAWSGSSAHSSNQSNSFRRDASNNASGANSVATADTPNKPKLQIFNGLIF